VLDSRLNRDGTRIRRRRECESCGRRFTTYERVEPVPFMVIKQDGRREPFDRDKILKGLLKACQKRPISPQKLEELADSVETVLADQPDREISTAQIGEMLMNRLYALDEVAYVRFASVYRRFENAREFLAEVMKVIDARQEG